MSHDRLSIAVTPPRPICPNGHTRSTASDGYFWCHDCSQLHGVGSKFDELRDPETGDVIDRDVFSVAIARRYLGETLAACVGDRQELVIQTAESLVSDSTYPESVVPKVRLCTSDVPKLVVDVTADSDTRRRNAEGIRNPVVR